MRYREIKEVFGFDVSDKIYRKFDTVYYTIQSCCIELTAERFQRLFRCFRYFSCQVNVHLGTKRFPRVTWKLLIARLVSHAWRRNSYSRGLMSRNTEPVSAMAFRHARYCGSRGHVFVRVRVPGARTTRRRRTPDKGDTGLSRSFGGPAGGAI